MNLSATLAEGQQLARIQLTMGVKEILEILDRLKCVVAELLQHQLHLLHPDAMLTGDGAAD